MKRRAGAGASGRSSGVWLLHGRRASMMNAPLPAALLGRPAAEGTAMRVPSGDHATLLALRSWVTCVKSLPSIRIFQICRVPSRSEKVADPLAVR